MFDKEQIRVSIDVEALYTSELGYPPAARDGKHLTFHCPWHPDQKTPNLKVSIENNKHRGGFKCFACGESGDVFAFVIKARGVPFQEALEALSERAGLRVNKRPREKPKTTEMSSVTCDLTHNYESWPDDLKDWMAGRGITPETVKRFDLAYAIYQNRFHALAFPYGDPKNDGYYKLRFYKDDYAQKFAIWPQGRPQRLFGLPVEKDTVLLVEGELDAIRLSQERTGASIISPPHGAETFKIEWADQLRGKHVALIYDRDEAGRKGAEKAARMIYGKATSVSIVELPEIEGGGKDNTDYLQAGHDGTDLMALVVGTSQYAPPPELVRETPLTSLDDLTDVSEGEEKPLIKFTRACDLKVPAMEWIIDGLIPSGMITLLGGKDTIGKTLFAFEIIQSVLTGEPLVGHWSVRKTGPVLVLPLDDAISATMERLEHKEVHDRRDLWVAPDYDVNLDDPYAMLGTLKNEAKGLRPVLVVLDALYCLVPGFKGAGIDQAVMGRVMRTIRLIASESGAGVLLVAHDNKSLKGIAGSHTISAGGKSIMRLVLPENNPDKPERVLTLEGNFGRSAKHQLLLESTGEKLPGGTLEKMKWTYVGTQREEQGKEIRDAILSLLEEDGLDGTAKEVATALKRGIEPVRKVLKELAEQEEIEEYDKPTGGRPSKKYRAWPLVPDEPLVPDVSELKSQGELIEVNRVMGTGGL